MPFHKLQLPPFLNTRGTSVFMSRASANGFGSQIHSANLKSRIFPFFPPKPPDWGTGNLRSSTCTSYRYDSERLQRCADDDRYHIVPRTPPETGQHVYAVQNMLINNIAFRNPGFAADLRRVRIPRFRDEDGLDTDAIIFMRWLDPFYNYLGAEFSSRPVQGTYGPKTTYLVKGWKDCFAIKRPEQPKIDNICGKMTIRSLDYFEQKFAQKIWEQFDPSNTEPWS